MLNFLIFEEEVKEKQAIFEFEIKCNILDQPLKLISNESYGL